MLIPDQQTVKIFVIKFFRADDTRSLVSRGEAKDAPLGPVIRNSDRWRFAFYFRDNKLRAASQSQRTLLETGTDRKLLSH